MIQSFIILLLLCQCDTGIALLAYMDGITGSPTLGGVVLAVLSAAGYAVFKVIVFISLTILNLINYNAYTFIPKGYVSQSNG